MSKAAIRYTKQIHKELGAFPTWFPGDRIEIGDVGMLANGHFRRTGSLAELGIAFEVRSSAVAQPLRYQSSKGLDVSSQVSGAAKGVGSLAIDFAFSQAGACVFELSGVVHHRITNRLAVGAAVREAFKAGRWDREWYLIEELWSADCATVIVAESKDTKLQLAGKLDSAASALANPAAGLRVTARSGKTVEIVGARNVTPMYLCSTVRGLGGNAKLMPVFSAGAPAPESDELDTTSIDELLHSMSEDDEDDWPQ